jgi:hypothetical protein
MRARLFIALLAAACTLVPAASASAKSPTLLKVRSCQVGSTAKARQATFYGRMQAVKGSNQMSMRFTLLDRAGGGPPTVVDNPALAQWRKAIPGKAAFGYAQTVAGLNIGGEYAVQVQFRWADARGRVIRSVKRTSGNCRQEGNLPNLAITRVAARAGDSYGTELYSVDVTNSSQTDARQVGVDMFVDGAGTDTHSVDVVKAGETITVRFTSPVCKRTIKAVADPLDTLNETNEDDNVLRSRCPVVGG